MSGPLSGIRVLDLTSVVSGPAAMSTLTDQGADVIKVESLQGDQMRRTRTNAQDSSPGFISCNRGKRSISLDLKVDEGKDILRKLITTASVFAQNFRPGAIERLGFGEPEVRDIKSDIVYLSISGVGETGPYVGKRVYDPVVQALSGLADIQADPITGRPRMVRTLVADKTTAIYAAQAVTAALFHRAMTGEGQHVRLSMLDTMVSFLWPEGMSNYTVKADGDKTPVTSQHDMIFDTADGYITVGTVADGEWRNLCHALKKPQWLNDPRFATPALRSKNREDRLRLVGDVLIGGKRDDWIECLEAADVPCAPVLRRREVLDNAQVVANKMVETFNHGASGEVRQARPAARFSGATPRIHGPAPALGEHTTDILHELEFDSHSIEQLLARGVVLATKKD